MRDMKNYRSSDVAVTVKSVCWAIIAVISIAVIIGKMEEDKTSFVAEQFIKHQEMRK
jgi:hypothetical protein